jgi:ATP-binding cassette subfamily C protein
MKIESNLSATTSVTQIKKDGLLSFPLRILRLALPFGRRRLGFVFVLVVLQGLFQVAGVTSIFPFLALAADPQRIYDSQLGRQFLSFLPDMSTNSLMMLSGGTAVFLLVAANITNIASEYYRNRYAQQYGHWLRMRLLNRILDQPYSYFLKNNSGLLFKKVHGDVMGYVNGVLLPTLDAIARVVTSILLVALLLFVHLKIALSAAVVTCGFYLVIYFLLKTKREAISSEFKLSWRQYVVELQQLLSGVKTVKTHDAEQHFVSRITEPSETISRNNALLPIFVQVPKYIIEPIAFGGIIAVVVYLNFRGRNMAAILPNLGVMALAGYRLMPALQLLYGQLTKISASRYTIEEVEEEFENAIGFRNREIDKAVQPMSWSGSIKLEKVSFRYESAPNRVLDSISLEIPRNTMCAFVGSTGCGKSTLIDLLTGLHQPSSGEIIVGHQPLNADNLSSWKATIGYVPQDIFLIDDSIAQNIAFGVLPEDIDHEQIRKVASAAQLLNFIEAELDEGFSTIVGERGVRLSGGQRQRIGLARALYHEPSVLILDEATSALDEQTESRLMDAIYELAGKKTIIVIAHRLSTVSRCNPIYLLESGDARLVEFENLVKS